MLPLSHPLRPPVLQASNEYLKFPAQLEQHIMEGSYNRVLSAKQSGTYAAEGLHFMDMLVDTVNLKNAVFQRVPMSSFPVPDSPLHVLQLVPHY